MQFKYSLPTAFILLCVACGGSVDSAGPSGSPVPGSDAGINTDGGGPGKTDGGLNTTDGGGAPKPGSDGVKAPPIEVKPSELELSGAGAPGGQTPGYQSSLDPTTVIDGESARLLAAPENAQSADWSATVGIKAIDSSYWGKRWRMRAKLKTENAGGGFAWFRIDQKSGYVIDNMINPKLRTVVGTTDWKEVALVLDVPSGSTQFAFGSGLTGGGKVWIGTVTLEEVGNDVATTPFSYAGTSP